MIRKEKSEESILPSLLDLTHRCDLLGAAVKGVVVETVLVDVMGVGVTVAVAEIVDVVVHRVRIVLENVGHPPFGDVLASLV